MSDPDSSVVRAAMLAHDGNTDEVVADLDFFLAVTESFIELDSLVLRHLNAVALVDPDSRETRFWSTLRAGMVAPHCHGGDL